MNDEHEDDEVVVSLNERRSERATLKMADTFAVRDIQAPDGTEGVVLFLSWDDKHIGFMFVPDDADDLADFLHEEAQKARERGNGS